MSLRARWPTLLAVLLIMAVNIWLWSLPLAQVSEGSPPVQPGAQQVELMPGVELRQTLTLPTPAPRDVALRFWTQRIVPAEQPFVQIRGESNGQVLGVARMPLAPADGMFHMRQAPWWQLPAGAQQLTIVIEGSGLRVATMATDQAADGDLALQIVSGDLGIERYLPLSRINQGKPGVLAWLRYPLALLSLYLIAVVSLLRSPARLLRWVEDSAGLSADSLSTPRQR
ncbi:MAG: hypothetical protein JOZ51_12525 [Chloroflexi bacterium]|nr:hypothetical protein [Chloroflexota bacterium]